MTEKIGGKHREVLVLLYFCNASVVLTHTGLRQFPRPARYDSGSFAISKCCV